MHNPRPNWAEVSLGALRRNYRALRKLAGSEVEICAVVKADAYGHGSRECARALQAEGVRWFGVTSTAGGLHLRVDTGMGRLGVGMAELPAMLTQLRAADRLLLEGVFTHLASAEVVGAADAAKQLANFEQAIALVRQEGFAPKYFHAANSAAMVSLPQARKNLVRPGIALY